MISKTPVPKREIVEIIMRTIPSKSVRSILRIKEETDPHRRLEDYSKNELIQVLVSTAEGRAAFEEAKAKYPLTTRPTLYMVSVSKFPDRNSLFARTENLAKQGYDEKVWFGSDKSIRSVYMITAAREYQIDPPFLEVPLVYEKKIEYVIADPNSEDYGEVDEVFSLENAIIWYRNEFNHALLLCGDFPAVKPILTFGNLKLGISWQLPYLSEYMLKRLAEGATPRSASFSGLGEIFDNEFDVQAMTIYDQALGDTVAYQKLIQDESHQQTAGFYSTHPDLVFGGLGISRQYGRIWTPTKLRKDTLLALSINLIRRTEIELAREAEINLAGFIAYYRNIPVSILGKKIGLIQRRIFNKLIEAVITARKSANHEVEFDANFIHDLISQSEHLDLMISLEANCENCGPYLLRCPLCQSPLAPVMTNEQQVVFQCMEHPEQRIVDNQKTICECGGDLEITFSTDIRIFPGAALIDSLNKFLSVLENQHFDGSFLITGNIFRLVPKKNIVDTQYHLENLKYWRIRAHFHQRNPTNKQKKEYRIALNGIKEKCSRNNSHPTKDMCNACMHEVISRERILSGTDICLPRVFGFAIDEEFDGIHHGHEIADIRYTDVLEATGEQLNLGIHLKSRERPRRLGLGRSVPSVKGLYTQYCYSAYLAARRGESLNAIGISVPNVISEEVVYNFLYLANQLGYPLVILAEDEWEKILDAAIEKAELGG